MKTSQYGFVILLFIQTSLPTAVIPQVAKSMSSSCAKGQICVPAGNQAGYMCCEYRDGEWISTNGQSCFPCNENPCGNGGTCIPDVMDPRGYICHCKDDSRGYTCKVCGDDMLFCNVTRKCIPKAYKCDDYLDCGEDDVSDELYCGEAGCRSDQFQCTTNLRCIPKSWVCNGKLDCGGLDFSDETQCPGDSKCPSDYICDSGKCISEYSRCDGINDCKDMSDEKEADCVARACKRSDFGCGHGHCIPVESVCDGVNDCADSKDEDSLMCAVLKCPSENKFRCKNGACVQMEYVCDMYPSCSDYSDDQWTFCNAWRGTFGNVRKWLELTSNRTNIR